MSDMITDELRRTMKAMVATAPKAVDADSPTLVPSQEDPRRGTNLLVAAAAFVSVLVIGGLSMFLFTGGSGSHAAAGPSTGNETSPSTTMGESNLVTDSGAAVLWRDQVDEALAASGIDLEVARSYETDTPLVDGGSVTAAVDDKVGRLVMVADLQGWSDGEYSTDPDWQAEVAGSTDPGQIIPEGTLFVRDVQQTSATTIRTIILVSKEGLLTLKAEETPTVPLIELEALESVAQALGAQLGATTATSVTPTQVPIMTNATEIGPDGIPTKDLRQAINPQSGDRLYTVPVGRFQILVRLRSGTQPHIYATSCDVLAEAELPEGWAGTCLERTLNGKRERGVFPYGTTSE